MRVCGIALLLLSSCSNAPAIKPGGIVSNNPCIDAILAQVAAPGQIAAVSVYSHRASSGSAPLEWSKQFAALGDSAEEVIAARPKLLLTGNLASNGTNAAIKRAGIKSVTLGVASSIADSKKQIIEIATEIGRPDSGHALNAKIDAAMPELQAGAMPIPALIWQSDGFVAGEGTIQDDLLRRTGFQNMSRAYGLKNWDYLPMENMLRNPPEIIFMPQSSVGDDGRALMMRRRVLRHLASKTRIVPFPDKLLYCSGPSIISVAKILSDARKQQDLRR